MGWFGGGESSREAAGQVWGEKRRQREAANKAGDGERWPSASEAGGCVLSAITRSLLRAALFAAGLDEAL